VNEYFITSKTKAAAAKILLLLNFHVPTAQWPQIINNTLKHNYVAE
jgi:glycine cleavage system protein P-like pyridoxal-binding family